LVFSTQQRMNKAAIEPVQAFADISHSSLYIFAVYKATSLYTCMLP